MVGKKKIVISILVFIVGVLVLYGLAYIPHRIVNIKPDEVSSIYIFSGGNGKSITITDKEDVEHIINNLDEIKFSRAEWTFLYLGYRYRITIYKNNGKRYKSFIINSKDTIRLKFFSYKAKTASIDLDFIENLMKDATN